MKRRSIWVRCIFTITLVALMTIVFAMSAYAFGEAIVAPVSIELDGELVLEDDDGEGALLVNGVTYVPLRRFCTLMGGCEIAWDNDARAASVTASALHIIVPEGAEYMMVNDRAFYCPGGSFLKDGTMYVPVRVISKAYGIDVAWMAKEGVVPGYVELTSGGKRAENASDVYDAEVLYWLSRIISAESRGESLMGQIAVGNVVLNRTRDEAFPNTVYDVIFDTKFGVQFTPISNGTIYKEPSESSVVAAKICLEGYTVSDKILYFLNEAISTNLWVSNNRTYIMTLGNHTFYS